MEKADKTNKECRAEMWEWFKNQGIKLTGDQHEAIKNLFLANVDIASGNAREQLGSLSVSLQYQQEMRLNCRDCRSKPRTAPKGYRKMAKHKQALT